MPKFRAAAFLFLSLPAGLAAQQATLWIPSDAPGAPEIISILEKNKDLRLTAAFSELPRGLEERINSLVKDGRLELALRPAGDPLLPLLYSPASEGVKWAGKPSTSTLSNDPYFLGLRLGLAKEAALKNLKLAPAGFVNPPGGLSADYFPLARAMGIKWLACGPLASTAAAVFESSGTYAVPFVRYATSAVPSAGLSFVVFDETLETDPTALRAGLAADLSSALPQKRLTVSEALKLAVSTQASPSEIAALAAPWSGDYTPWASAPAQAGALASFVKTRADLMLYLNSFQGSYKPAAPAFENYFSAEEGGKLLTLVPADTDPARETEIEILNSLGNAYRIMQRPPPPWLFTSLADAASAPEEAERLRTTASDTGFEITNIPRRPEIPGTTPQLPAGADPYKIWKLVSMKVEAGPAEITFKFAPQELDNSLKLASGFSHIRIDLYIDINHRPRAGMTRPLDGRPFRLFPDNAWEYALEINPARAVLYAVTPKGPVVAGTFQPKAEEGAVTVRVPREALKGNPLLWGYAALLLAPKDAKNFTITDYIASEISNGYIYAVRPGGR